MPTKEIRRIAGAAASRALPDEIAETLPVPVRGGDGIVLVILYYPETGSPDDRTVHPPTHAMHLDPRTGGVLRFWRVTPEELGIRRFNLVPGAGIPRGMTVDELISRRERVLDMSPRVWEAFSAGDDRPSAESRMLLGAYRDDFLAITKVEVAPFYVSAAPEFFNWLWKGSSPGR